ncbi:MAG: hypothetical protein QXD48_03675 [Candidatus Aenigmatarchaeota archaeon]
MFSTPQECKEYVEKNPWILKNEIKEIAKYLLKNCKEYLPRVFSIIYIFDENSRDKAYSELLALSRYVEHNYNLKKKRGD